MPATEATLTAAARDGLVPLRLFTNVCIEGQDLGPDFGTPVAKVPLIEARQLLRREQARVAFLGPCSRESRRCDTATSPAVETARCCMEASLATLWKIQEFFQAYEVSWWVDYGTALGVATDGKFFWNDKDCDIGVRRDDLETVLRMRDLFERDGFTFDYQGPGTGMFAGGDRVKIRWSESNHANTDIFFWSERDGEMHRRNYVPVDQFKGREFPVAWVEPLAMRPFEGREVPCPNVLEELVAHRYGDDWRNLPPALHGSVRR